MKNTKKKFQNGFQFLNLERIDDFGTEFLYFSLSRTFYGGEIFLYYVYMFKRYLNLKMTQNAEEVVEKGIEFYKKGEKDKAFEKFNKAIQLDPNYARAFGNRGRIHFEQNKFVKALKELLRRQRRRNNFSFSKSF